MNGWVFRLNNITKLLYQRMQCTYNLNYIIYYADN